MNYQKERDEFIARASAEGLGLDAIRKLLRYASTLQKLAVAQCNGDWPCDNGERKVVFCPRCEAGFVRTAYRQSTEDKGMRVCLDCRTQELVRECLFQVNTEINGREDNYQAYFAGDPRGAVLVLSTPNYPWDECGKNGARGLYVPARER